MGFIHEKIPQEYVEKFNLEELRKKYYSAFYSWFADYKQNAFLINGKVATRMDDEDFGTEYFLMYINGLWIDVETKIIAYGGEYKGDTWTKCGIQKATPFLWDANGKKQNLNKDELLISYDDVVSKLYEALTAVGQWEHDTSTSHTVTFEFIQEQGV
jgi:hypothetical protein